VIGRGNRPGREVNLEYCRREGIPVLRRDSGGGAVLLDPGCLCYSLILRIERHPSLAAADSANRWMLGRTAAAISRACEVAARMEGDSDLALGGRKVAGHAQRRLRRSVLLHGSILLRPDPDRMGRVLREPERQPAYRAGRGHGDFVTGLACRAGSLISTMRQEWEADRVTRLDEERVRALAAARYGDPKWLILSGEDRGRAETAQGPNTA